MFSLPLSFGGIPSIGDNHMPNGGDHIPATTRHPDHQRDYFHPMSDTSSAEYLRPGRWTYAAKYESMVKNAMKPGFLRQKCSVSVHDYGEVDGQRVYYCNGQRMLDGEVPLGHVAYFSSVEELLEHFSGAAFFHDRPPGCHVRWIDIDGMNGDIIQFLLSCFSCERRYIFNHIVDLR